MHDNPLKTKVEFYVMTGVFFPYMHPSLTRKACPEWVHFLSPGMPGETMRYSWFRPPDLPMSEQESMRYAQKVSEFVNQFRNPKDLSAFSAQAGQVPFYQDTVQALRDDLSSHLRQDTEQADSDQERLMLQGQMNLIMAWIIEEQTMALNGLNDAFHSFQRSMDQVLGVEDRSDEASRNLSSPEHNQVLVHWTKLLPWFLLFFGPREALVIQDTSLLAEWTENGVGFERLRLDDHAQQLISAGEVESDVLTAECTGADLMSRAGSVHQLPWMQKQIRVFCLPSG
jgi:hypothetical protein